MQNKKRKIAILLIVLLINSTIAANCIASAQEYTVGTGIITVSEYSSLLVREKPSTKATVLTSLSKETRVDVFKISNGWAYVKLPNGTKGYVNSQYLVVQNLALLLGTSATVVANGGLKAYSQDLKTVVHCLSEGETVNVKGYHPINPDYVEVVSENATFFVKSAYLISGLWELKSTETTTGGYSNSRNNNLAVAASRLDKTLIPSHSRFSFLAINGKCTTEKGYKEAIVFSGNSKVNGIGGGICQAATTINMAAKAIGIKTEANKHSLSVTYCKPEDEASVSYPSLDFKFINSAEDIYIRCFASGASFTTKIWVLAQ